MKIKQQVAADIDGKVLIQVLEAVNNGDVLDLFLYDEIKPDSVNFYTGETIESPTSAKAFQSVLEENKDVSEIRLFVNSRGGSVVEAMGIRAHLLRHKAKKTAYVDGWAASAASFILTACDEVVMLTGSMQMLHSMWVIVIGNAKELRKVADDLDKMMVANRQIYLEKSNGKMTEDQLIELMEEESWLTAEHCLELGLTDKVISSEEYSKINKTEIRELVQESTLILDNTEQDVELFELVDNQDANLISNEESEETNITEPQNNLILTILKSLEKGEK